MLPYLFLLFYTLLNFVIPPPCLPVSFSFSKCHSQYSFSCFSSYFCYFVPLMRQHILASQNPGHFLSKRFLTACLFQFPPSYLWLYFLCFFIFHHKSHFAYHHMVGLCDTLIHYYLTIILFFQLYQQYESKKIFLVN